MVIFVIFSTTRTICLLKHKTGWLREENFHSHLFVSLYSILINKAKIKRKKKKNAHKFTPKGTEFNNKKVY